MNTTLLAAEIVTKIRHSPDSQTNLSETIKGMLDEAITIHVEPGMIYEMEPTESLRDKFAMAALTGLASSYEILISNHDLIAEFGTSGVDKLQSNKAYRLADAMLTARK